MAKIISTYMNYDTSNIIGRADIPTSEHMSISGTNILCNRISTRAIDTLIGLGSDNIRLLCISSSVNIWSEFSPRVLSITNPGITGTLLSSAPSTYNLGDFAGYNHGAVTPVWGGYDSIVWVNSGSAPSITASCDISELDFTNLTALSIAYVIYNAGGTVEGYDVQVLSGISNSCDFVVSNMSNISADEVFTGKVVLLSSSSGFSESNALCKITNLTDRTINVNVKNANSFVVSCPTFTVVGASVTYSTGTISFTSMSSTQSYSEINLYARIRDWNNDEVGSDILITRQSYTAGATISGGSYQPNGTFDAGSYGYTFELILETSA